MHVIYRSAALFKVGTVFKCLFIQVPLRMVLRGEKKVKKKGGGEMGNVPHTLHRGRLNGCASVLSTQSSNETTSGSEYSK